MYYKINPSILEAYGAECSASGAVTQFAAGLSGVSVSFSRVTFTTNVDE